MNTFEKIYEQVRKIPKGRVASYGQIALLAGNPRLSRVVGYALHANPDPDTSPCHRVVTKNGKLSSAFAFGGSDISEKITAVACNSRYFQLNFSRYSSQYF